METDPTKWRVKASGADKAGWIVEIHDGDHFSVYRPTGADAKAATEAAIASHKAAYLPPPPKPAAAAPAGPATT